MPALKTNVIANSALKRRIIDISYRHKLSHIGSCITAVDIIEEIYATKKTSEKFILSSGHAGLALYVVNERYRRINAESSFKHHGVHPDRCDRCALDCSAGSLGHGLPIAVGIALADRSKNVYVLCSDGEMQEGSMYEALQVAHEHNLTNLKIYINCNEWGAYKKIGRLHIVDRCRAFSNVTIQFRMTFVEQLPFLHGQDAHYYVMNSEDYNVAMEVLK